MNPAMLRSLFLCAVLAALGGCVVNAPPVAEKTADGLERVPAKQVDTVYAVPGVKLAPYRRVILDSVEIAFKQDWQQRHPEITATDITRIRSQAAAVFREVFGFALSANGGYGLTTQGGPDVLRISTTISELDVAKASTNATGEQRMYVVSPQDLTLLMELRDSQSGALLVRAIDREKGRTSGNLQVGSEMANSTEARKALEMWAGLLRNALDEARAAAEKPATH